MSSAKSKKARGRDIVRQVFGGALYQQGRGYYTSLELFAILKGSLMLENCQRQHGLEDIPRLLPPAEHATFYLRPSHDFARRVLAGELEGEEHPKIHGDAERTLRALLRGLENPIPGARKTPQRWMKRHFFPYPSEMIHYDAVTRRGRVSTERYTFRGGGGLAHKILRLDPDEERLRRIREGFRRLLAPSDNAVGHIAEALHAMDARPPIDPDAEFETIEQLENAAFQDEVEEASWTPVDGDPDAREPTRWFELLRQGIDRVLHRDDLSTFRRFEVLMHWVPLCLAMHELAMARRTVGSDENGPLVFDAGHRSNPVRDYARRDCRFAIAAVADSMRKCAKATGNEDLLQGSQKWRSGPRTFFTTTLFAVGALNANTGNRYLAIRPALLETVAAALIDDEIPFEEFTEQVLYEQLGIVVDFRAARQAGGVDLDRAALEKNGGFVADRLDNLGLLRRYSDATRMVGITR